MDYKVKISLEPVGKEVYVNKGTPLIDILNEYGIEFPCGGKGTCGKCKVRILEGDVETEEQHRQKIGKLGFSDDWRLACYCKAENDVTLEVAQFENIILADETEFEFTSKKGFGIAVDLGTTTLVVQLLNLENGHILDVCSGLNPQSKYGSDLISRIQSCMNGRQKIIQELVRKSIGGMIEDMLARHRIEVSKVVIVGNTVMHHIFSGLDLTALSFYPFHSTNLGFQQFKARQLNWKLPSDCTILFYPSIGSFVGSDILAGIAATRMFESKELTILIDLGTNGEIVAGNCDRIFCASTAAGPAFEGAKINQGMRATSGAISSVTLVDGLLTPHIIGNVKAKGICGSGLVDVMAILIKGKKIGIFGEFDPEIDKIELASGIFITQQDIREFQLAKAAIAVGIKILLNQLYISFDEISKIFIAGGFGNYLNIENIIETGLIATSGDKIVKLGNTALMGAKMFLFEDEKIVQKILTLTRHMNLEGDPDFQDIYIDNMMLYQPE